MRLFKSSVMMLQILVWNMNKDKDLLLKSNFINSDTLVETN